MWVRAQGMLDAQEKTTSQQNATASPGVQRAAVPSGLPKAPAMRLLPVPEHLNANGRATHGVHQVLHSLSRTAHDMHVRACACTAHAPRSAHGPLSTAHCPRLMAPCIRLMAWQRADGSRVSVLLVAGHRLWSMATAQSSHGIGDRFCCCARRRRNRSLWTMAYCRWPMTNDLDDQ